MSRRRWILAALLFCACDGGAGSDAGTGPGDAASGTDASARDAGTTDAGPARPFEGPEGAWEYAPIEGARCANGSTLPVLVNRAPGGAGGEPILVYLQGGGACWDAATCFVVRSATHVDDTFDEAALRAQTPGFTRDAGPWANATWVYVPYCTGDLHAGQRVATYDTVTGPREVHHVGGHNVELLLARLFATVPSPARVTVAGVSAGAYGATLNHWRVRARWPGARVDVLADSGLFVDVVAERWAAMTASWDLGFPPGCGDCIDGLSRVLPHYGRTVGAPHRYALLAFDDDAVIRTFFGLAPGQVRSAFAPVRAAMSATDTQRSFVLAGEEHVLIGDLTRMTSEGTVLGEWLVAFATDDPSWDDAGP
ncbi:MAG: hypothetical protein KF729_17865 [Sandaracinaceae bacterium]|nr:hypothetical protein [Sandaracinaceae bacterium]